MSTDHAPYNYYLGPWQWSASPMPSWVAPAGTIGLVDLASLPQISNPGGPRSLGFFATTGTLDSSYALLGTGDCREIAVTSAMQSAWKSHTGYQPSGAMLMDLLWDHLTNGADPVGQSSVRPLMPDAGLNLDLYLGGHSLVRREKFVFGRHPMTNKVIATMQADYSVWYDDDQKGRSKPTTHLKCLDMLGEKFGIPDPENFFIPKNLPKEKPVKHDTTYTDNFNRANSGSLGVDWGQLVGTFSIVSNTCQGAVSGGGSVARYEHDLSSADHYGQCDFNSGLDNQGVCCRFSSSVSNTFYLTQVQSTTMWQLYKQVTGTFTQLQGATGLTIGAGTATCKANGSTITATYTSLTNLTATDTSITGNLRGGLRVDPIGVTDVYDNFVAADLGGAATYFQSNQIITGGQCQRFGRYSIGGSL